jgi:hypothetical protein
VRTGRLLTRANMLKQMAVGTTTAIPTVGTSHMIDVDLGTRHEHLASRLSNRPLPLSSAPGGARRSSTVSSLDARDLSLVVTSSYESYY